MRRNEGDAVAMGKFPKYWITWETFRNSRVVQGGLINLGWQFTHSKMAFRTRFPESRVFCTLFYGIELLEIHGSLLNISKSFFSCNDIAPEKPPTISKHGARMFLPTSDTKAELYCHHKSRQSLVINHLRHSPEDLFRKPCFFFPPRLRVYPSVSTFHITRLR